jgi:hypothetical protein
MNTYHESPVPAPVHRDRDQELAALAVRLLRYADTSGQEHDPNMIAMDQRTAAEALEEYATLLRFIWISLQPINMAPKAALVEPIGRPTNERAGTPPHRRRPRLAAHHSPNTNSIVALPWDLSSGERAILALPTGPMPEAMAMYCLPFTA